MTRYEQTEALILSLLQNITISLDKKSPGSIMLKNSDNTLIMYYEFGALYLCKNMKILHELEYTTINKIILEVFLKHLKWEIITTATVSEEDFKKLLLY
jgi:hypothetical protein